MNNPIHTIHGAPHRTTRRGHEQERQPLMQGRGHLPCATALLFILAMCGGLCPTLGGPERTMGDAEITRAIEADWWVDAGVSPHLLDVTTINGVATLSGSVESLLAKDRAVRIARSIRGVRAVVDDIIVRPTARSDGEIEAGIVQALARNPATDSYEVSVEVEDGIVTLKGEVESWQEKQLAAAVAKGVAGVRALTNDLVWRWTPDRPAAEIRADIEQRLAWDLWVDETQIDVRVADDQVTLTGSVGSAMEHSYAISDAWVAGVKAVDASRLQVRPDFGDPDRKPRRQALKTDVEIVNAVNAALDLDARVDPDRVVVGVVNGVVTLTGVVNSLQASRAAAQDAHNTVGVMGVDNRLKIRPDRAPADAEIAAAIREALRDSPYLEGQEGIRVRVVNQKAYLSGQVDSDFKRHKAENLAGAVRGVVAIDNHLTVARVGAYPYLPGLVPSWDYYSETRPRWAGAPGSAAESDAAIKERIEDQLFWSPFVDSDDIAVRVTDGAATLLGTVDSRMERGAAVDNAYEGGARTVHNELTLTAPSRP